jgi:hypothetical protein
MLSQDDFLAPNMSGEANLRPSSWKADAIRRGNLKISGPIPITEDTPLNEKEEKEFMKKQEVEPSPLAETEEEGQDHIQHEPVPFDHQPKLENDDDDDDDDVPPPQIMDYAEDHSQTKEEPPHPQQNHLIFVAPENKSNTQRRSATEPVSYSTPSPYPSVLDNSLKMTPRKRRSGIRNAFRKIFGRRSRGESIEEEREARSPGHGHHISVSMKKLTQKHQGLLCNRTQASCKLLKNKDHLVEVHASPSYQYENRK